MDAGLWDSDDSLERAEAKLSFVIAAFIPACSTIVIDTSSSIIMAFIVTMVRALLFSPRRLLLDVRFSQAR